VGEIEEHQVTLKFAARALREIEAAKRWWLDKRDKNPSLFEAELRGALSQIKTVPHLGIHYGVHRGKEVRYVVMLKTKYGLFYRIDDDTLIRVMSIWDGRRKSGPIFRLIHPMGHWVSFKVGKATQWQIPGRTSQVPPSR
jgi:hypothetical protein